MKAITTYLFSKKVIFVCAFVLLFSTLCFAQNPFIWSIYTADPAAHVWADGKIYVYASHDIDPPQGCNLMNKYHVFSSTDMVNWVDEGEILNDSQVPWSTCPGFMWAPDCAYKNGTYYFYFPHPSSSNWNNTWLIGVATSTKPSSGFTCIGYIQGLGGSGMIDPDVFIDDDGQAYIYYGGGGMCQGCKLNSDMISLNGTPQNMTGLQNFHEGTWVHKYNGLYYLSYADNTSPDNLMQYATSTNPLGPWTYRGVVLNSDGSECTQGSIVQYKNQWYLVYFNDAISGYDWLRSINVDKLFYNSDGTIQTVTQTTTGVPSVGTYTPLTVLAKYEAESAVLGSGAIVASDPNASGGACVHNMNLTGAYIQFNNVNGGSGGRSTINIYYASDNTLAKLDLNVNGTDYSYINTPNTKGWSTFTGHSYLTVPLNPGINNTIKLTGGNNGVNVDYITIQTFNDPTPVPPPTTLKLEAEWGLIGSGAIVANDSAASGGRCIQNMHLSGAFCQLSNINGGNGGSKTLNLIYAANGTGKLSIYVNNTLVAQPNFVSTGGWSTYTGNLQQSITLNSGTNNVIEFVGGNGGINLDYITIH